MISSTSDRPTSVSVIGWFWIIVGSLLAFHACLGVLFVSLVLNETYADPGYASEIPVMLTTLVVMMVCGVLAGIAAACGVAFLKRKPWSRRALEAFTWLSVVLFCSTGIWWAWAVIADERSHGFVATAVGLILGELIVIGSAVPLAIIIRYLRGDVVKNAICSSDSTGVQE